MLFYIDARGKREVADAPHEQLAAYVARVRAEKGLSLNEVRRRGDIPTSTIHKIERPRQSTLPKYDTLVRLARGLGVPLSDLLQIVGYQDQGVESASGQIHGNHGPAMVLRVVASGENAQNHGLEPIIGESSAAAKGIPEPGGQLTYVGNVVAVPILGAAACGEPLAAIMDKATEHLYLPPEFTRGADAAIRVRGDSMSGAGIVDGDFVLVKVADGVKPVSGKPVVVRTPEGYACKFYKEDDLGVYLEEHVFGQAIRRVRYDEAELVGIVIRQVRDW
jgi:SOS-response transcriptional repressor LexA/DNA-binding Xre family transcriptional regulator